MIVFVKKHTLLTKPYFRDMAPRRSGVQNLTKKHQLVEADILSHEDRIKDMNEQADSLISSEQFDAKDIEEKRSNLNERYQLIQDLASQRQGRLNEANTLHQFFRDIADEESWIKEKKLLVGSDDYGRDLTGVQNLKKKHKRLESELASHEPTIKSVKDAYGMSKDDFKLVLHLDIYI